MRLFLASLVLLFAASAFACPQEVVHIREPFVVQQFRGSLNMPGFEEWPWPEGVDLVVREKTNEHAAPRNVPVERDGTFRLVLADGAYVFSIRVEGFLFTVKGEVHVTPAADAKREVDLTLPAC